MVLKVCERNLKRLIQANDDTLLRGLGRGIGENVLHQLGEPSKIRHRQIESVKSPSLSMPSNRRGWKLKETKPGVQGRTEVVSRHVSKALKIFVRANKFLRHTFSLGNVLDGKKDVFSVVPLPPELSGV